MGPLYGSGRATDGQASQKACPTQLRVQPASLLSPLLPGERETKCTLANPATEEDPLPASLALVPLGFLPALIPLCVYGSVILTLALKPKTHQGFMVPKLKEGMKQKNDISKNLLERKKLGTFFLE